MPPIDVKLTITVDVHAEELVMNPPIPPTVDPMEGILHMLGRCSVITLHGIVSRQRQKVVRYVIRIYGRRAQTIPHQFVEIALSIHCVGEELVHGKMQYAFDLFQKYCPVHTHISASVPITHQMSWEEEDMQAIIRTAMGDITVALSSHAAPHTVANFVRYVESGAYTQGSFWRTVVIDPDNQPANDVKIEVIQATCRADFDKFGAIAMEQTGTTGLTHRDGTISMARFAPDSAQADFFICIGDQPELDQGGRRNPDGWGFAAFGQVIEGMDVVRQIQRQPQHEQRLTPEVLIHRIDIM